MIEASASRRLLVVDPCDDCHRLLPGLRTIGWDVDSCSLEHASDRTCDVGLCGCSLFTWSARKRSRS